MVITRWTNGARWANTIALAPRLELEQAGLRLAMGTVVIVALMWRLLSQANPSSDLLHMVWFLAGFIAIALAITLWMLVRPQDAPARKTLGIIADNTAVTYFMMLMGESGVLLVSTYMFVAFGNSYRYGALYWRISYATALLGFTIVLFASEFWSHHALIGAAMFIALLFLPLYVGVLTERLKAEWRRAEQELKECREALNECRNRDRVGS